MNHDEIKRPKNAPENIEWNAHFNMWMAIMDTNEQGEVTLYYWDKRGYHYAEIIYDQNNIPIKQQQFPPEGVPKNAVYVPLFDTWVTPENPLSEEKQNQLIEVINKFEEEQVEKAKQETIQEVKQELDQKLESIKRMTDEDSEFNTMFSALKQVGEIAKEVNEEAKIPKTDFEEFRTTLLYGFDDIFCSFVGGEKIYVNDNELSYKRKNWISPESGDWVFYDKRCQAGTFGVSHDDFSISKVTLKKPQEHEVDYSLPKIKRVISTQKLHERYIWLAFFFCSWEHRVQESPFNIHWGNNISTFDENVEALNKTFNKEIKKLKDDPYLAMYWLLHMGICCDNRYEQVKEQVIKLKLNKKAVNKDEYILENIQQCLAFFEQLGDYQNLSLDTKYTKLKNKDLFLIRRAFVVYITQSCGRSSNKEYFEKWWQSVFLYPKLSKTLVFRMYWLRKNLVVYNQWDKFDNKIQSQNINIKNPSVPLLSYVLASHPNIKNPSHYANLFLSELQENKELWSESGKREFVGTMLWNLKELFTDTVTLKEVMDFYFLSRFDDKEYIELSEFHFGKDESAQKIKEAEKQLSTILANAQFSYEKQDQLQINQKALAKVHQVLKKFNNEEITKLVKAVKSSEVAYGLLEHILQIQIKDKRKLLAHLMNEWSGTYGENRTFKFFLKTYIQNENDENINTIFYLLNNTKGSWAKVLGFAFMDNLHEEKIFAKLLQFLSQNSADRNVIGEFVYTVFCNAELSDDKGIYPPIKFSKEQMEKLLDFCIKSIYNVFKTQTKPSFDPTKIISWSGYNSQSHPWLQKKIDNWQEVSKHIPHEKALEDVKLSFEVALKRLEDED